MIITQKAIFAAASAHKPPKNAVFLPRRQRTMVSKPKSKSPGMNTSSSRMGSEVKSCICSVFGGNLIPRKTPSIFSLRRHLQDLTHGGP